MSLESSSVVLKDQKHAGISVCEVDTGAQLVAGLISTLEPNEALRVRCALKTACSPTLFENLSVQEEDRQIYHASDVW
jgi:hypothetical protein